MAVRILRTVEDIEPFTNPTIFLSLGKVLFVLVPNAVISRYRLAPTSKGIFYHLKYCIL